MLGKVRSLTTFIHMITTEVRLQTVKSTMEEAKALADAQDFLLVTAEEQTHGKGTRGRTWVGLPGNIYMTVGIHRRHLPAERVALLPLEVGLHVWEEAAARISPTLRNQLTLKWPNDLMFQNTKIAGLLMESHGSFLLVGLGVNVVGAPTITDGGHPGGCLKDAGMPVEDKAAFIEGIYRRIQAASPVSTATNAISNYDAEGTLLDWQGKIDWSRTHRLRDREGQPSVKPLSVNQQGHLQVMHTNGSREWLVADYLV